MEDTAVLLEVTLLHELLESIPQQANMNALLVPQDIIVQLNQQFLQLVQ